MLSYFILGSFSTFLLILCKVEGGNKRMKIQFAWTYQGLLKDVALIHSLK